jgi:hypothetical protein
MIFKLDSKKFKGEYHHKFNKQANQYNFTHAGLFYKNLVTEKKIKPTQIILKIQIF